MKNPNMNRRSFVVGSAAALSAAALAMSGCSSSDSSGSGSESSSGSASEETEKVIMACTPYSGQVLHALAENKGFYNDENVEVEVSFMHTPTDAISALSAGTIDLASTYGTSGPLQGIDQGSDIQIFAGFMSQGDMPILCRKGTEWNGLEDLIGKKVIGWSPAIGYYVTGPLLEAGYDPVNDIEWIQAVDGTTTDMEVVRKGEADFTIATTTGIQTQAKDFDLEAVAFMSDYMPKYSCCRVWTSADNLKNKAEALKRYMVAQIRALNVFEQDKDLAVECLLNMTELSQEYIEGFVYDEKHFLLETDPNWFAVARAWDYMGKLGGLEGDGDIATLKDHFNVDVYKSALDQAVEKYYDEAPEFYDRLQEEFESNNADFINGK